MQFQREPVIVRDGDEMLQLETETLASETETLASPTETRLSETFKFLDETETRCLWVSRRDRDVKAGLNLCSGCSSENYFSRSLVSVSALLTCPRMFYRNPARLVGVTAVGIVLFAP